MTGLIRMGCLGTSALGCLARCRCCWLLSYCGWLRAALVQENLMVISPAASQNPRASAHLDISNISSQVRRTIHLALAHCSALVSFRLLSEPARPRFGLVFQFDPKNLAVSHSPAPASKQSSSKQGQSCNLYLLPALTLSALYIST